MTVEQATTTFILVLVAQLPILVAAIVSWLKNRTVESKLEANTRTTEAIKEKADVIVQQTNGVTAALQASVDQLLGRVKELEDYNRDASHRVLEAVNAVRLKQETISVLQMLQSQGLVPGPPTPPARGKETS